MQMVELLLAFQPSRTGCATALLNQQGLGSLHTCWCRLQVLFTVVSREEKYSAKLVIDTLVQRLGDAMAAAVFQVLGEVVCLPCCVSTFCWLFTAAPASQLMVLHPFLHAP